MTDPWLAHVAAIALLLAACADMSPTQQRALSGTAGEAAGGPRSVQWPATPVWEQPSARGPDWPAA
jgi:hypothetical protein